MTTTYPGGLDVFTLINAGTHQDVVVGGRTHRQNHNDLGDSIEAIEAKVGTGGAAPATGVLGATGAGASAWRQLVVGDLPANLITQAVTANGATANPTTTSTTAVDLTNMTVTMTTLGGPILLFGRATVSSSAAGWSIAMAFSRSPVGEFGVASVTAPVANYNATQSIIWLDQPAAGTWTWKLRWWCSGGTSTANGTERTLMALELRR